MKTFSLVAGWLFVTTATILASVLTISSLVHKPRLALVNTRTETPIASSVNNYTTSFGQVQGIETEVEAGDGRVQIVTNFLKRHNSPLTPYEDYGKKLVAIADKNGIDFRLLPAIAMQESNLCKSIPEGSFNCLGFGIHSKGTLEFDSYEANFERAGRELYKNYIAQGRTTPEQIMKKYTPHSNGSWAASVTQWMTEMEFDDYSKGKELKHQANVLEYVATPSATPTPPTIQ
jgi:hypothetical protein